MSQLAHQAWEFMISGGPVMWPLLVASVWLWSLIIIKLAWLVEARRESMDLERAVRLLSQGGETPATGGVCSRALAGFLAGRRGHLASDLRLWEAAVRRQGPWLSSHLGAIVVLAAVAPLLGLLGTLNGMIETFRAIGLFGTGNAQALAAGIREALITTETGLLVAIPGLLAGYYLRRQVRKEQQRLLSFHQAVEGWLKRRGGAPCSA